MSKTSAATYFKKNLSSAIHPEDKESQTAWPRKNTWASDLLHCMKDEAAHSETDGAEVKNSHSGKDVRGEMKP